jgi:hypothetical protein
VIDDGRENVECVSRQNFGEKLCVMDLEYADVARLGGRSDLGRLRTDEMHQAQAELAHRLELEHAGIERRAGKMPDEHRIVGRDPPPASCRALVEIDRGDVIDEQKRVAMAHEMLDRSAPVYGSNRAFGVPLRSTGNSFDDCPTSDGSRTISAEPRSVA